MAYVGVRHCYYKNNNNGSTINIPVMSLSVKEKFTQLSGLNQNKRILTGYEISISTPESFIGIANTLGNLYWTSNNISKDMNSHIVCFKLKDVVFFPFDEEYQSKSEALSITSFTLDGVSNTTDQIAMIQCASDEEAKQKNSEGW